VSRLPNQSLEFIPDTGATSPLSEARGIVHIVGAGPGDPELLTVKALCLLQQADVIVHDRLVSSDILDLVPAAARRIDVGKQPNHHRYKQGEINALLVDFARSGARIVRLKGGDPFIFGRGGEELDYLRRHGVAAEVVPGITAATAAAASIGIPLTHRGTATAVTLVTGHGADGLPDLDFAALASGGQTLAIYMGVRNAGAIAAGLIDGGLDAATPVAVIENATTPQQRQVTGHLAGLEHLLREHRITAPSLLIVGEVVDAVAAVDTVADAAPAALAV
jgi:uroporphyrin-III C-methyltransferase